MRQHLLLLSMLCASLPAAAETAVLHSGVGRECYLNVLLAPSPEHNQRALSACDEAVNEAQGEGDNYYQAASLVNLSAVHLRMQDYSDVVAEASKAIAVYKMAPAYANLGAGMLGLGHFNEALSALNTAIAMDGQSERVYFNRAMAKEYLGDIRGAYYDYRMASEINPRFQAAADELTRFRVVTTVASVKPGEAKPEKPSSP